MASKIEWTDETWNPVVGCQVISPGCTNCYAMKMAGRLEAMGVPHYAGTTKKTKAGFVWTGKMAAAPAHILFQPLHWRRPRKIFVNSMSDLFADGVPLALIDQVWAVMALSPQHTYQILTKRAESMRSYIQGLFTPEGLQRLLFTWVDHPTGRRQLIDLIDAAALAKPLPNVWLGISAEDQSRLDARVPHLLETPAAIRIVSAEPLLGPLWFYRTFDNGRRFHDYLSGVTGVMHPDGPDFDEGPGIDQVIVGGERGDRPMHPAWVREIRRACGEAKKAFFFKQWGTYKEAFHDQDGDKVDVIDADDEAADAIMAVFAGRETAFVSLEGHVFRGHHLNLPEGVAWRLMVRASKRDNGRLLDGVEHSAMPEVSHG
jgi:protein gp37